MDKSNLAGFLDLLSDEDKYELGYTQEDNMEKQLSFFDEGGLADDGMQVDPESGNEIPAGSMASEVRDDVDAKLSEGEYVVPADVVRFFGVKFFEDLRNEAKSGMMSMESDGRIGGRPQGGNTGEGVSEEELQMLQSVLGQGEPVQMAEGGVVESSFDPNQYGMGFSDVIGQTPTYSTKTYQNAQGNTLQILFVDGQPLTPVPQGYFPAGQGGNSGRSGSSRRSAPATPSAPRKQWFEDLQPDNVNDWVDTSLGISPVEGTLNKMGTVGKGITGISQAVGVARTNALALLAEEQGNTALAEALRAKANAAVAESPFLSLLPPEMIDGDRIRMRLGDRLDLSGVSVPNSTESPSAQTSASTASTQPETMKETSSGPSTRGGRRGRKLGAKPVPEVETTSIGRADGTTGPLSVKEISDITESTLSKPREEYTFKDWKGMTRGQRKAVGLPVSSIGGELAFKRFQEGITGRKTTIPNPKDQEPTSLVKRKSRGGGGK